MLPRAGKQRLSETGALKCIMPLILAPPSQHSRPLGPPRSVGRGWDDRIKELWAVTFALPLIGLRSNMKNAGEHPRVLVKKGALDQGVSASVPLTFGTESRVVGTVLCVT